MKGLLTHVRKLCGAWMTETTSSPVDFRKESGILVRSIINWSGSVPVGMYKHNPCWAVILGEYRPMAGCP